MTALGGLLAVLVVLHVEGVAVRYEAPAGPDVDPDAVELAVARANFRLDDVDVRLESEPGPDPDPDLVTDGGTTAASPASPATPSRSTDPWAIVDAIKASHRGVDVSGGLLPSDILPGFGDRRFTCGDFRPHFCGDCAIPTPGTDVCNKSTCPHCAPNWARIRATEVCRKLAALRAFLDSIEPGHQKLHHLTISPAPRGETFRFEGDDPDKVRDRAFQAVYAIMDELGIQGLVVYHPYRGVEDDDRGFWKDILFDWQDWHEVQDELEYAPHFHVIGVADFVQGEDVTDVVSAETGWVIKRITEGGDESDSNVSIGGNLELARAVTYSLSHVGIYETDGGLMRYAGRWHGEHVQDVTAPEKYEMEWERIVRTVSTKTLGLKKKDLLCSAEGVGTTQVSLGYDTAMGSMTAASGGSDVDDVADGGHVDATGEVIVGSSGPVDAASDVPDAPDVSVEVEGRGEPCEGPLFDISRAPEFLQDDEWVEQAPYSAQLEREYDRWQIGQDFLEQTEADLDAIQEGRHDDVRIDWPPPD